LETQEDEERNVGRVRALVSVFGNVDFQGDRVIPGAFARTLKDWRKRGDPIPFIWSHQWGDLNAHVGWCPPDMAEETEKGLEVTAYLPLDDPPSAKVYGLLRTRRVRQFSFAFDVEEEKRTDDANELRRLTLYECGPCLLGANSSTETLEVAAREVEDSSKQETVVGELRQVEVKKALPSHGTATSDESWDGPANEAAIGEDAKASELRKYFAWVDPDGDEDTKAAYKFIHHFANGGAASTVACSTGIAVLNGGRGGTTIPDSDRSGVYVHLAKHLRDGDKEPPELASIDSETAATIALIEMLAL